MASSNGPPTDSATAPPAQGLVAGKYELLRLVGRGGMGSVWEGRHISLGTRVAVKFIEAEYASSTEARQRFDNEARAAATLQSKHAIQIHDHGVMPDGSPYIVMELLEGEPLDRRLDQRRYLPLPDTARILQQVCRALGRAHEKGIIHRDLKPENIFLVRSLDDDEEIAKVLDFGIAKFKPPPGGGLSSSTKTGAVLGTPYYMAPEQARGLRTVDHRADLWSLGVIAFKCATGVLPFDGESVGDLLVKICTAPLPVPSHVNPTLPPAFDAWFARALERDPDRRFASAQELSDALAFAAGVSLGRGPSTNPYRPPMPGGHPGPGNTPFHRSPPPPGPGVPAATPPPNLGSATQGPFSATGGGRTGSSSRVMVGAVAAAVVGLSLGVSLVYWKVGRGDRSKAAGSAAALVSPPPPSTLAGNGGPPVLPVDPSIPSASAAPAEPAPSASAKSAKANGKVLPAANTTPATKPSSGPGPFTPVLPANPPAPPPVTPPPSPKPHPNLDPGY